MSFCSVSANECNKASDPSSITVAGGSITEIIYALGQEDKLIAVDITCLLYTSPSPRDTG